METSTMIQEVMDMFSMTENQQGEPEIEMKNENVVLNNLLLTKDSEVAALKEVLEKWKQRAIEAESNAYFYYLDQLESTQIQHEIELKSLESRYTRKLNEQQDIISNLKDQVDYLIASRQQYRDTESYISNDENEEQDNQSIISSIYDRDVEQGLVGTETTEILHQDLKSETILCNIQNTMRAIEFELNDNSTITHQKRTGYRRSPTFTSDHTLIDPETKKKIKKKSSFFINRIFKKAFPKLYSKNTIYSTKSFYSSCQSLDHATYSTATTIRNDSIPNIRDLYTTVI